jgi:hypothetical protein
METSNLATFKIFNDRETAEDFAEVLSAQNISYFIEEDSLTFDPSYANNPLNKDYAIKIAPADFENARKAFENYFNARIDKADPDYYLFKFSDEELLDIIAKPDEWGSFDYALAQNILKKRGIKISEEEKEHFKADRLIELAVPEKEKQSMIVGYYVASILFFPIGIIIGWIWGYSKKQLPNGEKIHAYDANTQKHGRRLFIIGILLLLVFVVVTLLKGKR